MNLETIISKDLWNAVQRNYEAQAWTNSLLDSIHFLSDAIRDRTGLQSDGTALAGQALGGKLPKLQLNKLQTESEKNIQAGVEQLLRGLYQAIRNPRSHEKIHDTQRDTDALILFVDYLYRLLSDAKAEFSLETYMEKVFDEHFVRNKKYADILVSEIPVRQRGNVALAVFENKHQGTGTSLQFFFDSLIPQLESEDRKALFEAVSNELRSSASDSELLRVLQIFGASVWPHFSEAARLRTEKRIIDDIRSGEYSVQTQRCTSGAVATWSRRLWAIFTLKEELIRTIISGLSSESTEHQNYIFAFCIGELESLCNEPPAELKRSFRAGLISDDARYMDAYNNFIIWSWQNFGPDVEKAAANFKYSDDIPF